MRTLYCSHCNGVLVKDQNPEDTGQPGLSGRDTDRNDDIAQTRAAPPAAPATRPQTGEQT